MKPVFFPVWQWQIKSWRQQKHKDLKQEGNEFACDLEFLFIQASTW